MGAKEIKAIPLDGQVIGEPRCKLNGVGVEFEVNGQRWGMNYRDLFPFERSIDGYMTLIHDAIVDGAPTDRIMSFVRNAKRHARDRNTKTITSQTLVEDLLYSIGSSDGTICKIVSSLDDLGVETLGDLCEFSDEELKDLPGIGDAKFKKLLEVKDRFIQFSSTSTWGNHEANDATA